MNDAPTMPTLSRARIYLLAGRAGGIDPRSVIRYMLTDRPVSPGVSRAIQVALAELGMTDPRAVSSSQ